MNGYEFTRFESDFTSMVKAQGYDISIVAMKAICSFETSGVDYRNEPDYKDAEHWFLETTQSCDKNEAINWMKFYMRNAIAYGIKTKNLDWKTKFLAAYDIFNSLVQ